MAEKRKGCGLRIAAHAVLQKRHHPITRKSELRVKRAEASLLLPLRRSFLAAVKKSLALLGGMIGSERLAAAGLVRGRERVLFGPQARAGQEIMFHAGAGQLLQLVVSEVVVQRGARVLVRDFDAAYAFVIGRESYGHVGGAIQREGVFRTFDP